MNSTTIPPAASFSMQSRQKKRNGKKAKLPENFTPGEHSVICGRGKACFKSSGNCCLKSLITSNLEAYSKADSKVAKSVIVSRIIKQVRKMAAPAPAFVKHEKNAWWEVEKMPLQDTVLLSWW